MWLGPGTAGYTHHLCREMATDAEDYLAVLKASYDYDPQSEDEIAIRENQLLFLLQQVDDEYVRLRSIFACTLTRPPSVGGKSRSKANHKTKTPLSASFRLHMSNPFVPLSTSLLGYSDRSTGNPQIHCESVVRLRCKCSGRAHRTRR